ncbi:MAG: sugar ABC transporter permease [Defluviitaleaceae bacterium]|nr:sugar ABC transporter permease [Defluviitaleaceae bacterium]
MMRIFRRESAFNLFLLPSIIGLAVFYIVPFGISVYYALIDNVAARNFVGVANLTETWNNAAFQLALRNTVFFMGISIPLIMVLALVAALLLRPMPVRIRRVFAVFFILPLMIPSASMVFFWRHLVNLNGMVNRLLFPAAPIDWLNSDYAMWVVIIIFVWKNAGFNMILFQAGLDAIPRDYYEYAQIEGAGRFRQFRIVTLTYLQPTFFLVFILSVVHSFKVFREIYLLTGTHPHMRIYLLQHFLNNQFTNLNFQLMASASFYLFGFIFLLVALLYKIQQRQTYI